MAYNSWILSAVTFIYGFAGVLYIAAWIFREERPAGLATWVAWIALAGNTAGILLRWVESYQLGEGLGHAPFSNMYESLVFFAWTIGVIFLVVERRYRNWTIGAVAAPLACLAMAYASLSPDKSIQPLIPALQSNWLIAHVITCFLGYAAFAVAFAVSILFLMRSKTDAPANADRRIDIPSAAVLDELTHQLVMFGFLFLTAGIITGAVWAKQAWTRYWSWDPKETWSLITWFIYAALLHFRMMRGWRGRRIAILSIIGFGAVLFTYFGVSFLLAGLHSYGAGT
ncbi:MAG: c-type cytochrome biogenesis protein CcsB [Desulfatitalea sp.]|nr:c-type cytochrome biogenesis protein CcsB [Desulfatitalea sp.]NNJ98784.1 c-type cytochrome biogenesis protein CcsB [Desulfatitalea sp.]